MVTEFLVVGHVARDLTADGWMLGGTAAYASLAAARLGLQSALLTSADPTLDLQALLPGVEIHCLMAARTTVFERAYEAGRRTQWVRALSLPIAGDAVPPGLERAEIVLLGPLASEVDPEIVGAFPAALIGATAQGWLRRLRPDGLVSEGHVDDLNIDVLAGRVAALFLSEEDLGGAKPPRRWTEAMPIVALTRGRLGARLCLDGAWWQMPVFPAGEVDPTGAGDAFAAGFLLRYHETGSAAEAARFAAAVSSFVVEAEGIDGIPSRSEVEDRMRMHPDLWLHRE